MSKKQWKVKKQQAACSEQQKTKKGQTIFTPF